MKIHPLRRAYIRHIKDVYGVALWGDKSAARTEIIAQQVRALGISFEVFIRLSVSMWDTWAKEQGHPYPYWNVVTSDTSFESLKVYLALMQEVDGTGIDADEWMLELDFALDYIDWVNGEGGVKPRRDVKPGAKVRIAVSDYICQLYGVEFVASNYNYIARQIANES